MFSPEVWFTVAINFYDANEWFNWTLSIMCLVVWGWIIHNFINEERITITYWANVFNGISLSAMMFIWWPLVFAAIPILLMLGFVVGLVLLPKWVSSWLRVRKVEKAAMKAMAESVDKS